LALYIGISTLDNSSGKYQGSKQPKHVNTRAKAAMMVALDHHRKYVPQSQSYYEKKRSEGKKHNQAIRALGRHLSRIVYKMLTEGREYQIRPEKGNTKSKVSPRSLINTQIRKPKISAKGKNHNIYHRARKWGHHPLEISSGMIRSCNTTAALTRAADIATASLLPAARADVRRLFSFVVVSTCANREIVRFALTN
jgi:hypothetical protein